MIVRLPTGAYSCSECKRTWAIVSSTDPVRCVRCGTTEDDAE